MKRKLPLLLLASLLLVLPVWGQDGSKGNITASAHDFRLPGATTELCGYCHIPHQLSTDNRTLLWNHKTNTAAAYTAYSSDTLNATVTALDQTNAGQQLASAFYSLACLTCHDGATAVNVVYRVPYGFAGAGSPGTFGTAFSVGTEENLGIDLRNDHPVNFTYNAALATADKGLYDPSTGDSLNLAGTLKTVRAGATFTNTGVQDAVLFNGTVQCATCHNPHNNTTYRPFLRVSNSGSALCLKCHSTT